MARLLFRGFALSRCHVSYLSNAPVLDRLFLYRNAHENSCDWSDLQKGEFPDVYQRSIEGKNIGIIGVLKKFFAYKFLDVYQGLTIMRGSDSGIPE